MRRPVLGAAVLLGVSLLACLGPYPNVGEKLDVVNLVNGTSYIALDAGAARILILAPFDGGPSAAPFIEMSSSAATAADCCSWSSPLAIRPWRNCASYRDASPIG